MSIQDVRRRRELTQLFRRRGWSLADINRAFDKPRTANWVLVQLLATALLFLQEAETP